MPRQLPRRNQHQRKLQRKRQLIRKSRRALGNTICNLKDEEYFINNLDLSVVQEVVPDETIDKKDMENIISETSSATNENYIKKGEFNKKKDEINPGQKLEVIQYFKVINIYWISNKLGLSNFVHLRF